MAAASWRPPQEGGCAARAKRAPLPRPPPSRPARTGQRKEWPGAAAAVRQIPDPSLTLRRPAHVGPVPRCSRSGPGGCQRPIGRRPSGRRMRGREGVPGLAARIDDGGVAYLRLGFRRTKRHSSLAHATSVQLSSACPISPPQPGQVSSASPAPAIGKSHQRQLIRSAV